MNDLIIYLLKVSAGLGIIFLPYYFLFRNDPNLVIKRFYLLSGVLAAWTFPFITFRKLSLVVDLTPTIFIDLGTPAVPSSLLESTGSSAGLTINWLQVLLLVYLAGLTFMFLKNLIVVFKWNHTWKRTKNEEGVAYINNDQVFTLFTRIFIPGSLKDKNDLDNILLHEQAHIRQLHFIDLMIIELTLLLTWFNPFSWLISRMIKENHEHMADRQVLSAGVDPARYRAQLMNHTLGVNVFRLGNQFNHSLTLNRFKMMKKPKRSPWGILKIAMLIPAVLVTLGLTTGTSPQQKTVKGKVILADTEKPATGASIVIRNSTVGTVVDRDGTFSLNMDGNPELVISYVGYSTLIVGASEIGNKPLKLELKTYTMDLESLPLEVKKESSGTITLKQKDGSDAQPVFVLDGKVVSEIDNLDPDLIDNISVFKDPNSEVVKKYNAKDGVVMITTKEPSATEASAEEPAAASIEKDGEIFYIVEDMPKFPGGLSALKTHIYSNLEYPEKAKSQGIEGEVSVRFLIGNKGNVVKTEVLRSTYEGFDAPALKVINEMPEWTPGKQRGKPVQVWYVITVKFNDDKK
ncbi:MAG: TonB family protein [Bacteroidia bacterium]|nr:MAG: TonB family protein [Bacteroidia bacterium]